MKKRLSVLLLLIFALALVFTSCDIANKKVESLQILSGAPTEVEVDKTPDFSAIKVKATYNDGEVEELGYSDVTISAIDTSKVGTAEYTVSYKGASTKATINVKSAIGSEVTTVTLESITYLSGIQTEFFEGSDFHLNDLKVTAHYSDGSTKTVTSDKLTVVQNIDRDTAGDQTLILSYEGKQLEMKIKVMKIEPVRFSLVLNDFKSSVLVGNSFDTSLVTGTLHYSNSATKAIANSEITFSAVDTTTAGQKKLVGTYQGMKGECTVEVLGIKSIDFSGFKTAIKFNEELDLSALKAKIIATDNNEYEISADKITVDKTDFDPTLADTSRKITVISFEYCGMKKEYNVTVTADKEDAELISLKYVSGVKTELFVGEAFDDSNIIATATRSFGYNSIGKIKKADMTVEGEVKNEAGTYTLTYSLTENGVTKRFTLDIVVKNPTATDIKLNKTDLGWVVKGEKLDTSSITATVTYDYLGRIDSLKNSDLTITAAKTDAAGDFELTVSYEGFEKKVTYKVVTAVEIKNIVGIDTTVSLGSSAYEEYEVEVEILLSNGVTIERTLESDLLTIDTSSYSSATDGATSLTVIFGDASKKIDITVVEMLDELALQKIEIQENSLKSSIFVGDTYDYSTIKIKAFYNYNRTRTYAIGADGMLITTSGSTNKAGSYVITVSYTHNGVTKTASFTVEVKAVVATELEISGDFEKSILLGDKFDTSKITAILHYNNGTKAPVSNAALSFDINVSEAGEKTLTVTHKATGLTDTATVTVVGIESVIFNGIKQSYRISEAFDTDDITVTITGTDGNTYTREFNSNVALPTLKLNLTKQKETSEHVFSYCGVEYKINIEVYAEFDDATLYEIEYNGATRVFKGDDLSKVIAVKAIYTYGFEKVYTTDITISGNVTTDTTGTYTFAVIYAGKTADATISVVYPKVTGITIEKAPYGIKDEDYDYDSIIVTITLENNKTFTKEKFKNLADYNIEAIIDVTEAGIKLLTLSADGVSHKMSVIVYEIERIVIDTDNFDNVVQLGSSFSTDGLGKILVYLKGLDEPAIRYVTEFENNVDTETMGRDYTVTTTYLGIASEPLKIAVADQNRVVSGIIEPQSIVEWKNDSINKDKFLDAGYKYFVGDDNPFRYELKFDLFDTISKEYIGVGSLPYESESTVTLNGEVVGSEYVIIDETKHTFDFTEAAIGKTFVITTAHSAYPSDSASLEVLVVDGYNIYDAIELNLLTNENSSIGASGKRQLDVLYTFLSNNNVAGIENMSREQYEAFVDSIGGIILHNNLTIATKDLPDDYFFITSDGTKYIWDHQSIYNHAFVNERFEEPGTVAPETFSIYGNYFTVLSFNVPIVAPANPDNGTALVNNKNVKTNDEDGLSSSELFFFDISNELEDKARENNVFYAENYVVNIYALALQDNDQSEAVQPELARMRSKLGIIGIKMRHGIYNLNSVRADRYFITTFPDNDDLVVNYNYCTFYDSWSNHIMSWSLNSLDMTDDIKFDGKVHEGYQPIQININNSFMGRCGGSVIITVNKYPSEEFNTKAGSGAIVNIDSATNIFSYVKGTESWFEAYKASSIAVAITTFNNYFASTGSSFITNVNGNTFFNFIILNMDSDFNPVGLNEKTLFTPGVLTDIDGCATIGDKTVLDMNDLYGGYGHNGYIDGILSNSPIIEGKKFIPPIFATDLGGVSYINPLEEQLVQLTPDATKGNYVTLYMLGLGALMRLNEGDVAAEPTPENCTVVRITENHGID